MASSGSIWVSLGLNTANFQKGIKGAKGQLSGFQKFSSGLKGMFNPFTIGVGAIAAVGVALTDAMGTINNFEKANSELEAVLGESGTAGAMMLMSDQAKALGASTAFTATEVSGLQRELAKLGFNPSEIQNMTGAVLDLAAASGTDLAEAAASAGGVMNAFGLSSKDTSHVADVMALSFSSSALDMEKFSETMKQAAPIARATGVSLEVATAAAGKLADNTISGSKAGTDLKNIFSELVKDGKPFQESLGDIATQMESILDPADKLQLAEDLVGEKAKASLLILLENKDALGELAVAFEGADGSAKQMADTMLDNVTGSMTKMSSAYEGAVLSIEDGSGAISQSVKGVIDSFTGLLAKITAFNNTDLNWGQRFAETSGVAGIALGDFDDKLVKVLSSSTSLAQLQGNSTKAFAALKTQFDGGSLSLQGYKNAMTKLKETIANTHASLQPTTEAVIKQKSSTDLAAESWSKLTAKQKEEATEIAALKAEFGGLDRVMSKSAAGLTLTATSTDSINEKIKRFTTTLNTLTIGSEAFNALQMEIEELKLSLAGQQLQIPITPTLQPIPEEQITVFNDQAMMTQGIAQGMGEGISGAMGKMADGMISSMGDADTGMGRFKKSLAKTAVGLIATNMATAMSNAITGATSSGAATGPGAAFATPGFIAAAVAGIIGAFASIPAFAAGGLVTGATTAIVGEGRGTTTANPEVIAPLDKLKGMLGDTGGGMGGEVVFRISGDSLMGILDRKMKINKFSN